MKGDNVLIIGSGGREHALAWKLAQSPDVSVVYVAPGNAGTSESKGRNVPFDFGKKENFQKLYGFVKDENIKMVVVGPEAPLCDGIVDYFNSQGYNRIFGPTMAASALESDKFFSYNLMHALGIPQAKGITCHTTDEAYDALHDMTDRENDHGIVIKARRLTGGKGVTVCDTLDHAIREIHNHAKEYGPEVLISERLFGEEFSVFGISDGKGVSALEIAVQDHKPRDDGDRGPNTGGMGAYCPVPIAPSSVVKDISERMLNPLIQEMARRGTPYLGFIYAGMMTDGFIDNGMIMAQQDGPKVLEFNCRMGDPETQPAMMMLKSDLYHAISSALDGKLGDVKFEFNTGAACGVVCASQGYPGSYKKGFVINGLDAAGSMPGVKVFHAGTKLEPYTQMIGDFESRGNRIVTSGGRVLCVTAYSENGLKDSIDKAYEAAGKLYLLDENNERVEFQMRRDIGAKGLRR